MQVSGIQGNGNSWQVGNIHKAGQMPPCHQRLPVDAKGHIIGSPLLKAASDAFESYLGTQEALHNAAIASLATYCLSPQGGAQLITPAQMAPLLALAVA